MQLNWCDFGTCGAESLYRYDGYATRGAARYTLDGGASKECTYMYEMKLRGNAEMKSLR